MDIQQPAMEIIKKRYSCRTYSQTPIKTEHRQRLADLFSENQTGPFGTPLRFQLITATKQDHEALKDLGTYGFIKGATGFILGSVSNAPRDLEDYGYAMEKNILFAADMGLGTCWLGGSFAKSAFSQKISAQADESVPAVTAIGYAAPKKGIVEKAIRWGAGSKNRKPWHNLFFDRSFNAQLSPASAGGWAEPLEAVRLAPSASNRQPWRIVKQTGNNAFHFYMQRTKGYYTRNRTLFNMADLQRVDMGIAMCHFEMTCSSIGLSGSWQFDEPEISALPQLTEYVSSWVATE